MGIAKLRRDGFAAMKPRNQTKYRIRWKTRDRPNLPEGKSHGYLAAGSPEPKHGNRDD